MSSILTSWMLGRRAALQGLLGGAGAVAARPLLATAAPVAPAPRDPLFLLETHVAGTAYYRAAAVIDRLAPDQALILRREPTNRFDKMAIEVFSRDEDKLGYVPRVENRPFARLMDAGHRITATISRVKPADWDRVRLRLFLEG